jgi:homoserine dehydrogenase
MIKIGILGNGTVGSGVIELLKKNTEYIKRRSGTEIKVVKVLVRDKEKHQDKNISDIITNNIEEVFSENPDIVVEAIGGLHPAYEYIKRFLQLKKHVVTANKDVIANYGDELSAIAEENGVNLRFEASVAGGIPILKPLQECLAGNDIRYIIAILNGTTNFILSKMYGESMKYDQALKIAQELGFAEANPDSDVLGYDAARKLSILSSISYNEKIDWEKIKTEGITEIDEVDINYAKLLDCKIKLLAVSSREEKGIYAAVRPAIIAKEGFLGMVDNEFNGILLEGDAVGQMFFCGKGAGKLPTASAVLGDIFDVIENKKQKPMFMRYEEAQVNTKWSKKAKWLIRINVKDINDAKKILINKFENAYFFEDNICPKDELALLIEIENENILENKLANLYKESNISLIKKLVILNQL